MPNPLIHESSPYLLQHAHNPVNWYPWGSEAFQAAENQDKLIILSIGYSTCHWCHVMEKQCFEDISIADLMNRYFINIKVDREERPDIDALHMIAVNALTGSGGWPLNLFLTPSRQPFYGGTYFPAQSQLGMTSWPDLLQRIAGLWQDADGRAKIIRSAAALAQSLNAHVSQTEQHTDAPQVAEMFESAATRLAAGYDARWGGFSPAPKFPLPASMDFLLTAYRVARSRHDDEEVANSRLQMVAHTLNCMAAGGICDQLGGGFHRYATDTRWHAPHFEKMLYDNAQLASAYLHAFAITGNKRFAQVAEDIIGYVLRDMTDGQGGFYSAEDADSLPADHQAGGEHGAVEKQEGAFYLWTQDEIDSCLQADDASLFCHHYGARPDGNVTADPHGMFTGANILFLASQAAQSARKFNLTEDQTARRLAAARQTLFDRRTGRARPHCDDKIIVSWNGLMIAALAQAGALLEKPEYLDAAETAADFLASQLYDAENRQLYRIWRLGRRRIRALSSDYAFFSRGLIDLYHATGKKRWLDLAVTLTHRLLDDFQDPNGGFFMSAVDADPWLTLRVKSMQDNVMPAANSIAVENLIDLAAITQDAALKNHADKHAAAALVDSRNHPGAIVKLLEVLWRHAQGLTAFWRAAG